MERLYRQARNNHKDTYEKEARESYMERRQCDTGSGGTEKYFGNCCAVGFEYGACGHEPKNVGGL